jgi:2-dehydropantoate 2-reductase
MGGILIEGIGGVGGVIAGKLLQAGFDPVLITGNASIRDAIRSQGLAVTTPTERFVVPARAFTSLNDLPADTGPFDAAFLVMKAAAVVAAAEETVPHLDTANGFVVTLQNGIVQDAVAAAIGAARVIPGIVGFGATMHAPAVVERTGPGKIHLGELSGQRSERLQRAAHWLGAASEVELTDNIIGAQWAKLAINCTITTLGALTGQTLGEMLVKAPIRRVFLALYREVVETAWAAGVTLETIAANPTLLYLPERAGSVKRLYKDLLVRIVGRRYAKLVSSSLQSLQRGRKTEVDFLNGYVIATAQRLGRSVPVNTALVGMIKEIEAGTRPLQPANIDELIAKVQTY